MKSKINLNEAVYGQLLVIKTKHVNNLVLGHML